jgi:hypothetical protein
MAASAVAFRAVKTQQHWTASEINSQLQNPPLGKLNEVT